MPTRGSKDPNGRALRGRRAHTTFALLKGPLLTDPARQIWDSFNNRANAGGADAPEAAVDGCLYDRFKSLYNKTATKPSLVIVPARFKSGTLYSQIPSSNADFTVTRNTAARRFNSAGLIESVASGIPRLDYYTSGGVTGCPALLVEPAATNLALQSADFNTTWSKINLNVSTNATATTDPAGGNTADLLTVISGSTQAESSQVITTVSGTAYVFSFFGKKGSGATNLNSFRVLSSNITTVTINWDTGVLTQTGTPSSGATAQNFGNGWWRISIPFTAGSTSTTVQVCSFTTYTAGQNSYRWGAQLELGSVATSYIPTTTVTGSRSADVISVSGAVSGSIGQTQGTIYWEGNALINGAQDIFFLNRTTANAVTIYKNSSNFLRLDIFANSASAVQITNTVAVTGFLKLAAAYKSGDTTFYINGQKIGSTKTNAITFTGALNSVVFAHAPLLTNGGGNQQCRAVALYTTRLSDSELAALTTL